jgi:hypothetical protein
VVSNSASAGQDHGLKRLVEPVLQNHQQGDNMRKFLSILIAAVFAVSAASAFAASNMKVAAGDNEMKTEQMKKDEKKEKKAMKKAAKKAAKPKNTMSPAQEEKKESEKK